MQLHGNLTLPVHTPVAPDPLLVNKAGLRTPLMCTSSRAQETEAQEVTAVASDQLLSEADLENGCEQEEYGRQAGGAWVPAMGGVGMGGGLGGRGGSAVATGTLEAPCHQSAAKSPLIGAAET